MSYDPMNIKCHVCGSTYLQSDVMNVSLCPDCMDAYLIIADAPLPRLRYMRNKISVQIKHLSSKE